MLVLLKAIFIDRDLWQIDSKTLKNFPFPNLEHLGEVEAIAKDNFLSQSRIGGDTKTDSRAGVYIVELLHFHFTDTNIQIKNSHAELIDVPAFHAFGVWT